ncbi:hypothetical protein [Sphingomonas jaspsi]|uniref:hypothetical protein n=1 Tax=Sphingomonas jaspsi TaxID=392409 RepID=UPI0012EC6851|nr:hypothetical protein [Sphingomonas jaspsi]
MWVRLTLEDAALDALPTTRPGWSSEPALPSDSSLSLLVAGDNPVNQMLIGALLKKMGHRVDLVDNGRAAVEAAAARR